MKSEGITGVLSAAARLGGDPVTVGLILVLAIVVIVIVARWPPLGLIALLIGSLIIPLSIGTGTQTQLNFTVIFLPLLIAVWLSRCVWSNDWRWLRPRPNAALLAFAAVATLSLIVANVPSLAVAPTASLAAQLGGLSVFLLSAAVFVMVADQIRDVRWLQLMTVALLALGALYVVRRVVPVLRAATAELFQPGSDGSLFWTWVVGLAFAQAAFNRRLSAEMRVALATVVLTAFYAALTQNRSWAGGWLPPLIAVLVALCVGAPRLGVLATLGGAAAAAWQLSDVVGQLVSDDRYSLLTRLEAWRVVAQIAEANPLLGLGPANYYHSTPMFPILGWNVHFSSHNTYVDIFAQTGLLGLACFLWFVWEVGRLGWRLLERAPVGFTHAYVVGALAGLGGTLVAAMMGDWLLPFVYNVGLKGLRSSVLAWFFLGGLMALDRLIPPQSPPS